MVKDENGPADSAITLDWLASTRPGFGRVSPEAEFRYTGETSDDYSVTETWWFEMCEPTTGLTANFYIAMKPNLGICSAGSWMWRGHKREQLLGDHVNFQVMIPEPRFEGTVIRVPQVGLEIEFIAPLEQTHIRYNPPGLDVSADLMVTALFAPAMRSNERHFEQATWTKGTITLHGERIAIDGPSFRDRSFGEPRREDQMAHPPIGWLYGVIGGGTSAFNLSGTDDPASAEWANVYPEAGGRSFYDGWVIVDGEMRKVVSMAKRTRRDPDNLMRPVSVAVDFTDDKGQAHRLIGAPRTSFNMHFWPNLNSWFGLTEWELDGVKGIGGCQDYIWPDYARRFWLPATDAR